MKKIIDLPIHQAIEILIPALSTALDTGALLIILNTLRERETFQHLTKLISLPTSLNSQLKDLLKDVLNKNSEEEGDNPELVAMLNQLRTSVTTAPLHRTRQVCDGTIDPYWVEFCASALLNDNRITSSVTRMLDARRNQLAGNHPNIHFAIQLFNNVLTAGQKALLHADDSFAVLYDSISFFNTLPSDLQNTALAIWREGEVALAADDLARGSELNGFRRLYQLLTPAQKEAFSGYETLSEYFTWFEFEKAAKLTPAQLLQADKISHIYNHTLHQGYADDGELVTLFFSPDLQLQKEQRAEFAKTYAGIFTFWNKFIHELANPLTPQQILYLGEYVIEIQQGLVTGEHSFRFLFGDRKLHFTAQERQILRNQFPEWCAKIPRSASERSGLNSRGQSTTPTARPRSSDDNVEDNAVDAEVPLTVTDTVSSKGRKRQIVSRFNPNVYIKPPKRRRNTNSPEEIAEAENGAEALWSIPQRSASQPHLQSAVSVQTVATPSRNTLFDLANLAANAPSVNMLLDAKLPLLPIMSATTTSSTTTSEAPAVVRLQSFTAVAPSTTKVVVVPTPRSPVLASQREQELLRRIQLLEEQIKASQANPPASNKALATTVVTQPHPSKAVTTLFNVPRSNPVVRPTMAASVDVQNASTASNKPEVLSATVPSPSTAVMTLFNIPKSNPIVRPTVAASVDVQNASTASNKPEAPCTSIAISQPGFFAPQPITPAPRAMAVIEVSSDDESDGVEVVSIQGVPIKR